MSTQINVTVGSGGLPDKAKQQQQAARQAQLEKERQRRIEAEGAAQRTARLAAEGRNAQGQSLNGTPNGTPRPQDEPAAFRQSTVGSFGYFKYGITFNAQGKVSVFVRSGNGQQEASAPYPYIEPYADPFSNLVTTGELTGAPIVNIIGSTLKVTGWQPVLYDSRNRIVGSTTPVNYEFLAGRDTPGGDAQGKSRWAYVWIGGYNLVDDISIPDPPPGPGDPPINLGPFPWYAIRAKYDEVRSEWFHIMPSGKNSAIVVVYMRSVYMMDAWQVRIDRRKRFEYSFLSVNRCFFDSSPPEYTIKTSALDVKEEFHAFAVSTTGARYLGQAPTLYQDLAKAHPLHRGWAPSDITNITSSGVTYSPFYTYTYDEVVVTYQNSFNESDGCIANNTNSSTTLNYWRQYTNPSTDALFNPVSNSIKAGYKAVPRTSFITTPSTYAVFKDYANYALNPAAQTEAFNTAYFPSFVAKLNWRTHSATAIGEKYVYTGTPPASWGFFGPTELLAGFPANWKKENVTKSTLVTGGTGQLKIIYDWENPRYCAQQATSLGFTSADLKP